MSSLKNKVALVTGASSGMGKDFAKALLNEGMTVYAAARRVEQMDDIKQLGAIPIKMDVTNDDQVQAAVKQIETDQGGVDVLINNAGFGLYGSVEDTTIDDARYQFEVNLFGMARLTQLLVPSMRNKNAGTIVNISSMGGKIYTPLGAWYHATKHAVEGWSDCLRLELQQFGINVVIIEPGIIQTEFGDVVGGPMTERSKGGPYEPMAQSVANATADSYKEGGGSSPQVVTDLLLKALKTDSPKTRYHGGKYAGMMMFIRKYFGDRAFDKMVLSTVK